MSDLIKREDAIEAIKKNHYNVGGCGATLKVMIEQIRAIPSADRPRGEWIFRREFVEDTPFTGCRCSNCNYWKGMGSWNYCPNCGCRMKGADDEH